MRLVLVHGINQQGRSSQWIEDQWKSALKSAMSLDDFALLDSLDCEAPFYGDVLYEHIKKQPGGHDKLVAQSASDAAGDESNFYRDALTEIATSNPSVITSSSIADASALVEQNAIYDNKYVIGLLQALQSVLPDQGESILRFLPQAFVYLNRIQATEAVDDLVRPALEAGSCIVLAHSLGSIVSFKLLRELEHSSPLLFTFGSPLAIKAVQGPIGVPFGLQPAVSSWTNIWDRNDLVTLGRPLDDITFGPGIGNIEVDNSRDEAHAFGQYLRQPSAIKSLVDALREVQ